MFRLFVTKPTPQYTIPSRVVVRDYFGGTHTHQAHTSTVTETGMLKLFNNDTLIACYAPGCWQNFCTTHNTKD